MKKFIKKYLNWFLCKKNEVPTNCVIHRTAHLNYVKCEGKNKIAPHARLTHCCIGYGTFVAKNTNITNCKIGRYSLVGFESLLGGHPIHKIASVHPAMYSSEAQYGFTYVDQSCYQEYQYAEEDGKEKWSIVIGNDVWVTAGSTKINQNIKVGDGAVVMSGAIVTKDVPPYAIVGGVPAKIIGYRFTQEQIENLLKLKWWDRGEEWIKKHAKYFGDINELLNICKRENLV